MKASGAGAVVLHADDDVAVLLAAAGPGATLAIRGALGAFALTPVCAIPAGHKIALRALSAGSPVRKYGEVIGVLAADVTAGDHVHVHNLRSARGSH